MPPTELTTIRDTLRAGRSVNPVTVREFLSWFDAKRRGISIVARIREELESLRLSTVPDLEEPWIDGLVAFHLVGVVEAQGHAAGGSTATAETVALPAPEAPEPEPAWEHARPATGSAGSRPPTSRWCRSRPTRASSRR